MSTDQLLDETLLWLCAVPSPIGEERALCDAVEARMAKRALAGKIRRTGDSIVVPVTRGPGPKIALLGHLDTVRTENGPARIEGGRCFGSGASDMKSGLAVMIALAETLDLSKLGCELTLVFYAREEGAFADNELGPVLDGDPELAGVDLGVCLEPSNNKLHLGCMGSIHASFVFEGRTAHSARPWEGENAITKAAEWLGEMGALQPKESIIDGLTYRSVTTITQAHDGGRGRNVVPDQFVLNVNHRFAPDQTLEQAGTYVRGLARGRARGRADGRVARGASQRNPPARARAHRRGRARRGAETGVDGRRASRGARRRRGQLRPGRERPGAPEERVDLAGPVARGIRHRAAMAGDSVMERAWRWFAVAGAASFLMGCPLPQTDWNDAGGIAPETPSAPPGVVDAGALAANQASVTRYPDETSVDNVLVATRWGATTVRTQASASGGSLVATLKAEIEVNEIARRQGFALIVFTDPKNPSRTDMGWVSEAVFNAEPPHGHAPVVKCPGQVAVLVQMGNERCVTECTQASACPGGQSCTGAAPLSNNGVPGAIVEFCEGGGHAGPAPQPSTQPPTPTPTPSASAPPVQPKKGPLDVKMVNGACPGGYAKCAAICRMTCASDAECGLSTAHCQRRLLPRSRRDALRPLAGFSVGLWSSGDRLQATVRAAAPGVHSSVGISEPSVGISEPSVAISEPSVGISEPSVGISEPSVGISEPSVGISELSEAIAESNEAIAESNEAIAESNEAIAESNEAIAESNEAIAESNEAIAESNQAIAESNKAIVESPRAR